MLILKNKSSRINKKLHKTPLSSNTVLKSLSLPALIVSFISPAAFANYNTNDNSIKYFKEAQQAARDGDINQLYQYEQMMSGGLFAMYPTYWRLNNDIGSLEPNTVIDFVNTYPKTVMAEKLIADYAENKASSGDYQKVREVSPYIINADNSENCAIALGNLNGGDSMQASLIKQSVWLNTFKQPNLCDQFATELTHSRLVSQQDLKNRLYLMLRKGKTGDIMALSNALGSPIDYTQLQEIQFSPTSFFNRFTNSADANSPINQYLYLYALGRVTNTSYQEAAMQLEYDIRQDNNRSSPILNDETRKYAYRTIAVKRMNMNTDDGFSRDAVTWFRNSVGVPFNFEEAEDYAMAAIRYSEWSDLVTAINSMEAKTQQDDEWQYWLARAYENSSNNSQKRQAKQIFKQLANNHNYYGFLAKDKLGQRTSVSNRMPGISRSDNLKLAQNPNFSRAFALYENNADRRYANREWNWAVKQAMNNNDTGVVLAAAKKAQDLGWLDRAIYATEKAQENNSNFALSHPMPYQNSVVNYSRNANIDPAWAYGIMRQESRFVTSARSGVGASGLMQIMPATGKYVARNLGEPYNANNVNSGDTNIRYGTWYIGDILRKLNFQPTVATAGYNAGPNNAKRWLPTYDSLPADQFVETIAYPETRNYVKRVMENATIYGGLLGQPKTITNRMGTVWGQ